MDLFNSFKTSTCFSPTAPTLMDPDQLLSIRHSLDQARIHRKNLLQICSLAVHEILDKYEDALIDETFGELHNLMAILENILRHRLKSRKCWFGYEESIHYWEYIREISININNGTSVILTENLGYKSPRAKGRAWLRMALIEKRLHIYFMETKKYKAITKLYYAKGAFLLSPEAGIICQILEELIKVDFNLCLRDNDLEIGEYNTIDYIQFLKPLKNNLPTMYDDASDDNSSLLYNKGGTPTTLILNNNDEDEYESGIGAEEQPLLFATLAGNCGADKDENPWKYLFYKMEDMYKKAASQKKKMENMLEERDRRMETIIKHNDILTSALKNFGFQNTLESRQIDGVINGLENLLTDIEEKKIEMARDISPHVFKYKHHYPIGTFNNEIIEPSLSTSIKEFELIKEIPLYTAKRSQENIGNNLSKNQFLIPTIPARILSLNDIIDDKLFGDVQELTNINHRGRNDVSEYGQNTLVKSRTFGTEITLYDILRNQNSIELSYDPKHHYNITEDPLNTSFQNDSNTTSPTYTDSSLTNFGNSGKIDSLTKSISCHMMASFIKQRLKDVDYLYEFKNIGN